jgi:hypothetical protein
VTITERGGRGVFGGGGGGDKAVDVRIMIGRLEAGFGFL